MIFLTIKYGTEWRNQWNHYQSKPRSWQSNMKENYVGLIKLWKIQILEIGSMTLMTVWDRNHPLYTLVWEHRYKGTLFWQYQQYKNRTWSSQCETWLTKGHHQLHWSERQGEHERMYLLHPDPIPIQYWHGGSGRNKLGCFHEEQGGHVYHKTPGSLL